LHADAPETLEYEPGAQFKQNPDETAAIEVEYVPARHDWQIDCPCNDE
jgi:hypothetical protein